MSSQWCVAGAHFEGRPNGLTAIAHTCMQVAAWALGWAGVVGDAVESGARAVGNAVQDAADAAWDTAVDAAVAAKELGEEGVKTAK